MELRNYRDDFVDGDELLHTSEPAHYPTEAHAENPASRFRYNDYEWEGFKVKGQVTLKLTKGYFTFVGEEDLDKIAGRSVCAHEDSNPRTGELIQVRAVLTVDGRTTYLHRFLMSAHQTDIVDHVNNLPLDNRSSKNLWIANRSLNNSNRFYKTELSRGVKRHGLRYRGQIWFKGQAYFSKVVDTKEEAQAWYVAKYAEFHGTALRVAEKPERNYPIFPPRIGEDLENYVPF